MLDQLQSLMNGLHAPTHPTVAEAFLLHQDLAAYYFLRAKAALYIPRCQTPALKEWWTEAATAIDARIKQLEGEVQRLGVPVPPDVPVSGELTDHFMAVDGMAMVKGMLMADVIGVQTTVQPDLAVIHRDMFRKTLTFGGSLMGLMEREGWAVLPPDYQTQGAH